VTVLNTYFTRQWHAPVDYPGTNTGAAVDPIWNIDLCALYVINRPSTINITRSGRERPTNTAHVTGLAWTGLDWPGLAWPGLDWTGLDWTGLDWTGLDWTGLDWTAVSVLICYRSPTKVGHAVRSAYVSMFTKCHVIAKTSARATDRSRPV